MVHRRANEKSFLHGSVQSDVLIPEEDKDINTGSYDDWGLTNTYVDLNLMSKNVEAGARLEFTEYPLPGFENDFQGWGVPHIYIKGIRTYEERSLGIDNALRGARLNVTALKGVQFKVLGGLQRRYWDWKHGAWVGGADLEVNLEQYCRGIQDKGITWMVGASGVLKQEGDEDILVSGTNYRLNLPRSVGAFDVRSRFQKGDYSVMAEYAWKSQDPSFDNGYIYRRGECLDERSMNGISAFVNNMPAFAYQHTYALPALYPYATQAADGEWAFQGEFGYTFKRRTPLGGKYGTKLKLNVSHIRGLGKDPVATFHGETMGTDGYKTKFFKMDGLYYQDINVQLEKKRPRRSS